jgi:hypothetical protein
MNLTSGINLLCRLRDCHCNRIVLDLEEGMLSAQELLALGFYRERRTGSERRLFFYDRDEFNEPRQWNTPEAWAHPENFRKYRW